MQSLHIHTHCQVAQKSQRTDQNLSKSIAVPSHGLTKEIKHENTTNCKLHCGVRGVSYAGFSQHRSVLPDRNALRNPPRQLTSDRCSSF